MVSICVVGGGPAGSIFAIRMAQLGHQVALIESARFPRPHLGESLSPGVLPLLKSLRAEGALGDARVVREVEIAWEGPMLTREDSRAEGRLVDRGTFDQWLIEHARSCGVRIHQPARIIEMCREKRDHDEFGLSQSKLINAIDSNILERNSCEKPVPTFSHRAPGWRLIIETEVGREELNADFLADARGRHGAGGRQRETTGPATLALHAYWEGAGLPMHPMIKAGDEAWYWAVPLPDDTCNIQAFVDARRFGALPKETLAARYFDFLDHSGFPRGRLKSDVMAKDATPFIAHNAATLSSIALGEAALALDPLSSSGVQKAIQTSLSGAIVANTLIRKPASAATAMEFYQTSLEEASTRHLAWAAGYYAQAARTRPSPFWQARAAAGTVEAPHRRAAPADPHRLAAQPVELSRDLVIAEIPCIEGEFVTLKPALRHPRLAGPVAFLGDQPLAPLIGNLRSGATLIEIAQAWSQRMPFKSALSIALWLRHNGILIDHAEARQ